MPLKRQNYICIRTCAMKAIPVVEFTHWAICRRKLNRYIDKVLLKILFGLSERQMSWAKLWG